MNYNHILSLLGLAKRGGHLAVGEEPVEAVARARDARLLILAADAADNTVRRCRHFAEAGACLYIQGPFTKDELGSALGRTSVAIVALTDIGLAAALAHKLEALDPQQYHETAEKLDLKAQRAAERKAEQAAHEKNLRTGRKKPKKAAPAPADPPSAPEKPALRRKPSGPAPRRTDRGPSDRTRSASDRRSSDRPRSFGGSSARPARSDSAPFAHSGDHRSRTYKSRPSKDNRPKPKVNRFAHSRPVKKGKGSFNKKG